MHKGVLRDIENEKREKDAALQASLANCEIGICDLAATRFRDPVTGLVKAGPAAGATVAGAATTTALQ